MTSSRRADSDALRRPAQPAEDIAALRQDMARIRGDAARPPDASIVVPVNARGDLDNALRFLGDLASYDGEHLFEVVMVVNNYSEGEPPQALTTLADTGVRVIPIPRVDLRVGDAIVLAARLPGVRAAASNWVIAFDADCRLPHPTATLDWYAERGAEGYGVAYTHVRHYDLPPGRSVRVNVALHHLSRWAKRVILRIPTTRGSSYAVRRDLMLAMYEEGFLADDLNVGPAAKARRARIAYTGDPAIEVLTSGRMLQPGWRWMVPYYWYRLRYNLRVIPVRSGAAARTQRELQNPDRYDYTKRR